MSYLFFIWINFCLYFIAGKSLKYFGTHIKRFLSLSDIAFIVVLGLLIYPIASIDNMALNIALLLLLSLIAIAVYIDVSLFRFYTIELEPYAIKSFLLDSTEFLQEAKTNLKAIVFNRLSLYLILMLALNYCFVFAIEYFSLLQASFLSLSLFIIAKSRCNWYVLSLSVAMVYPLYLLVEFLLSVNLLWLNALISLLVALGFLLKIFFKQNNFLHNRSSFGHIVGINPIAIDKNFLVLPKDEILLKWPEKPQETSSNFGLCKQANVIVFSIESLGKEYIEYYGGSASYPVFERLSKNGLVSKNHYCVSPNTNNALFHMYHGNYSQNQNSLQALNNYDNWFITSQTTAAFRLRQMMQAAGFNHTIGEEQLRQLFDIKDNNHWGISDKYLSNQAIEYFIDNRAQDRPFWLHILNTQSHVNYQVGNKEKYHKFSQKSNYGRYLNSIEETNELVESILDKLAQQRLLDNTILVLCGDHGQSFGLNGYKVHANSVIAEQMLTPLVIAHPKISPSTVELSSHFDILPSIFSLLGFSFPHLSFGQSLFEDSQFKPIAIYSETKRGNLPSSFGFVSEQHKLLVDLIYKKVEYLSHDDSQIITLSAEQKRYYLNLAHAMLQKFTTAI